MNAPVLVAALLAPLAGALLAALVPSGHGRSLGRRSFRRGRRDGEGAAAADDEVALVVDLPEPVDDAAGTAGAEVTARTLVRVAALSAAALWIAVVLLGGASAGRFSAEGAVGPAAAGAALALAAVSRPARRGPAAAGALALTLVCAGLALASGQGAATSTVAVLALAAGVAMVALATAKENDGGLVPVGLALLGMTAVSAGLAQQHSAGSPLSAGSTPGAAATLVMGGALLAAAGGLRPRRTGALLLPVGLAVGVGGAAALGSAGEAMAVVLSLSAAAAAGVSTVVPRTSDGLRLVVVSLALLALASAAVPADDLFGSGLAGGGATPPGVPAAWLLAAAAVVTSVALVPLAALSAVPGAAALAAAVAADPDPALLAVAGLGLVAAAASAFGLQRSPGSDDDVDTQDGLALSPLVAAVPALGIAAWLVLAPRSWAWVGDAHLSAWPESVALALAGGLIGAVVAGASGRLTVPPAPCLAGPDPAPGGPDAMGARAVAVTGGVALCLALVALLVASGRAG